MTPPKRSFFQKVTHRLGSNFYQINGMLRTLTGPEKLRFLFLSLRHAKSVIKTDRLLSVDEQMAPLSHHSPLQSRQREDHPSDETD